MKKSIGHHVSGLSEPRRRVDWDDVDYANKNNNETITASFLGAGQNFNVTDSQFQDLSPESAAKLLDKDRFNLTTASIDTRASLVSHVDNNETIGAYFYKRSDYPEYKGGNRLSSLREEGNPSDVSFKPQINRKSIATSDRRSLASVKDRDSITDFFKSSKSNGISRDSVINCVMKYCMEKQNGEPLEQSRGVSSMPQPIESNPIDETYSQAPGIMDVSSISSIDNYSAHHSTPKRNSQLNFSSLSLKDLSQTGKSFVTDLMPMLSNLTSHDITHEAETIQTSIYSKPEYDPKKYTRSKTQELPTHQRRSSVRKSEVFIKPESRPTSTKMILPQTSEIFRIPVVPKKDDVLPRQLQKGRPPSKEFVIAGHPSLSLFKPEERQNDPMNSLPYPRIRSGSSSSYEYSEPPVMKEERGIGTDTETEERNNSPNSSISSSATTSSNAATQCQLQIISSQQSSSQQSLSQPVYGYPIFIQVQCPCSHGHGVPVHGVVSQNSMQQGSVQCVQSLCQNAHSQSQINQIHPMMPMPTPVLSMPMQTYLPPFVQPPCQQPPILQNMQTQLHCKNCSCK